MATELWWRERIKLGNSKTTYAVRGGVCSFQSIQPTARDEEFKQSLTETLRSPD